MNAAGIGTRGPSEEGPNLSRFAEIVRHLPVAILVWRRGAGERRDELELVFVNPAAEASTGRSSADVQGRPLAEAFPEWRDGPLPSLLDEVLENRDGRAMEDLHIAHADGTTSCFALKAFPLSEGTVALSLVNTTDRYNERSKIERLEHQLLHAQKMEMVGRAAGGIAHDFNNLLTAVLGHSELALETLDDRHAARAGLERVREAGKRAAELTRRLLAVSRHQFSDPEILDLDRLVGEHAVLLRSMIGEDVDLRLVPSEEPLLVMADQAQVGQVLLNLVVNAKDAMPEGGELEIRTATGEVPESGDGERRAGSYVTLSVTDTGRGIEDEVMDRIFDPFFTTKSAEKGTGLGLPTVASIVEDSGGFVKVESRVGEGSRFTVFLPRVNTAPTPDLGPSSEPLRPPSGSGATVLVAEDEETIRTLITDLLAAHGYRVIEAESAGEALERSGSHEGRIDLLITDVVMPRTSGIELARRLRESRPDLPVLLMSGYTGEALRRGADALRDVEVLRKPFTPGTLLERVGARIRGGPDDPGNA